MNQQERLDYLLSHLLAESGQPAPPLAQTNARQKRLAYRALVNVRPPLPVDPEYLAIQDAYLRQDARERGTVSVASLPTAPADARLVLWQGDIRRLRVDAIVNAANSELLGCFYPNHNCIDNAIHTAAGVQLRQACFALMQAQRHPEATGGAKITPGFNLPAAHVIHTVGPITNGTATSGNCAALSSCYASCLRLAAARKLKTVAFCCISTGEFKFPAGRAAAIAVQTVREYLDSQTETPERIVFDVYTDEDKAIYERLLGFA